MWSGSNLTGSVAGELLQAWRREFGGPTIIASALLTQNPVSSKSVLLVLPSRCGRNRGHLRQTEHNRPETEEVANESDNVSAGASNRYQRRSSSAASLSACTLLPLFECGGILTSE